MLEFNINGLPQLQKYNKTKKEYDERKIKIEEIIK